MPQPPAPEPPLNLLELEALARARLPRMAYDYYASGADDQQALARNRASWSGWVLRPRVLVDVSRRDLSTTVLGHPVGVPVVVAPTAFHKLACPEGELAAVRAAGAAGAAFTLSTLSNTSVEEVARAAAGPLFFQLYVYRDRGATRALVERALAAGCRGLVLTVDAPIFGQREADVRNGFHLPPGLRVENMGAAGLGEIGPEPGGSGLSGYIARQLDPTLSWKDLEWLCGLSSVPLMVKGILRGDDAIRALDHGAAGVVVSNHGGRQLDAAPAPLEVLPEVAASLGGRGEIWLDGGVRRGTDVLKALALGARAVQIGRPVLWGLAWDGEAGAAWALGQLRAEIDRALALSGCPTLADLTPDMVARA